MTIYYKPTSSDGLHNNNVSSRIVLIFLFSRSSTVVQFQYNWGVCKRNLEKLSSSKQPSSFPSQAFFCENDFVGFLNCIPTVQQCDTSYCMTYLRGYLLCTLCVCGIIGFVVEVQRCAINTMRCSGDGGGRGANLKPHIFTIGGTATLHTVSNMKPHVLYSMRLRSAHCTILYQAVPMWSPIENPLDQAPPPPYEDKYPQLDFYQWGQSHRCYQGLGWVGEVISAGVSHF